MPSINKLISRTQVRRSIIDISKNIHPKPWSTPSVSNIPTLSQVAPFLDIFNQIRLTNNNNSILFNSLGFNTPLSLKNKSSLPNANNSSAFRRGLEKMGITLRSADDLYRLNAERTFSIAMQQRCGIPIYNKGFLLAAARKVVPSVPMDITVFPGEVTNNNASSTESHQYRAIILMKEGCGYIKPISGARSKGVAKIEISGDTLIIKSKDELLIALLSVSFAGRNLGFQAQRISPEVLTVRMIGQELDSNSLVKFFELLEEIIEPAFGSTIFEGAVNTPLIEGEHGRSTWEIRVINQTLENELHQTSYAKVGTNEFIGNISTGGSGQSSLAAISAAYRTLLPDLPDDKILELSETFIAEAYEYAKRIRDIIAVGFAEARDTFLPDYPFDQVMPTNFSTDFMGMIVGDRLVPYVIDINFYYGMKGLSETDTEAYNAVTNRSFHITSLFLDQCIKFIESNPQLAAPKAA